MSELLGLKKNRQDMLFAGAAAIVLALLVLAGSFIAALNASQGREERVALLWNRYALHYYVLHGGWDGISLQLQAAAEDYPEPEFESIAILAVDGQAVARYGGGAAAANPMVRKPIVDNGNIIGFTETVVHSRTLLPLSAWLLAITAGAAGFGIWMLQRTRRATEVHDQSERLYRRMAALIPAAAAEGAAADADDRSGGSMSMNKLEKAVEQVEAHMRRLETVRRSMVADFAHELRTPLAVMRSQLENTLNAGVPLPLAKAASIHDETLHLSKLVHDLQDLALAEAGRLPLEKRWFSLRSLSEAVIEALQGDAEERGIALSLQADKDVTVYADSVRMRQLIVNLTGNALRYARKQVAVEIALRDADVVWTVRDDGFGIEEEQLPSLFERFYRGPSVPTSGDSKGIGLGLAIAKQYAEAHGGTITVASRWGEGSSFEVRLPVMA